MVRELRLDYGGHSFRWFDTDEMIRVHGSSSLPSFLAQNIEEHFRVPVQFQVLCDLQGPLSTRDFQRVLSGKESPRLWLFDSRYMGEDLRKQFERRQAEAAIPASDEPTTLWSRKLETLVEEASDRSGNDDDMEKRVAKLSESLEKREEQVAKLLDHHEAQIQELQRELSERTAPPIEANGWEASDSEDESNLQLLEAEEARLLQSVQDALAKITDRTPSTTCEFQARPGPEVVSPSLTACSGTGDATRSKSAIGSHSGPLPPLLGSGSDTFCQYCGEMREKKEMRESREIEETRRREEEKRRQQEQLQLEEAMATMRKAQEEEKQSQLLLRQWQARAVSAEEALTNQEHAEVAQVKLHGKLEVEVALRNKDLEYAQELRTLNEQNHRSELEHQASVLALRHRNAALLEQEEWQQMEILLLRSQQFQSEKAQEQQVQDLMSSVEWERLGSELRVSQLGKAEHRSKKKTKDLGARLVGRDLEVLALESLMERQQQHFFAQQSAGPSEAQKKAEEEAKSLAAELMQKAEMLQQEEAARSMHLAEIAMQGKELVESKCREEQLQQRLVQLEAQLADALAANARPATPKLEPTPAPAPKISDYISTADDELDKTLEKEIMDLGPGILKGNVLERTGPKRYKLGDQKVFMQLSEGKVTVRVGGAYIPLLQWTKELTAVGEKGNDDPFSALDAQSPFAAVR